MIARDIYASFITKKNLTTINSKKYILCYAPTIANIEVPVEILYDLIINNFSKDENTYILVNENFNSK